MNSSPFSRAVDSAQAKAAELGHRLGKWDFWGVRAYAVCGACGSSAIATFVHPVGVGGNAVELPCRDGEANVAPPAKPEPPTGAAKELPKPKPAKAPSKPVTPPAAPSWDDCPFPTDAPVRDCVVAR